MVEVIFVGSDVSLGEVHHSLAPELTEESDRLENAIEIVKQKEEALDG